MIKRLDLNFVDDLIFIENNCFSHSMSKENIETSLCNDKYRFFGFFDGEKLVGYGSVFIVSGEGYINNIAVLEDYRHQGIASQIIEKLIDVSKECEFVTLEVRESNNPAINLYSKYGFKQVALRKNYYSQPIENAIIMTKYLEK